jgi:hypothetical protein
MEEDTTEVLSDALKAEAEREPDGERAVEKAPADHRMFGMGDGEIRYSRTAITNWLLFIAALIMFLGTSVLLGTIANKNWIFYVSFIGLCFLGASVLAGVKSHINYALAHMWQADEGLSTESESPWFYRLNRWAALSFWGQLWLFGIGMLLGIVATLAFFATYQVSQGL